MPAGAESFFGDANNENLKLLDDQIRAIRLLQECTLRCKKNSFNIYAEWELTGDAFSETESLRLERVDKIQAV